MHNELACSALTYTKRSPWQNPNNLQQLNGIAIQHGKQVPPLCESGGLHGAHRPHCARVHVKVPLHRHAQDPALPPPGATQGYTMSMSIESTWRGKSHDTMVLAVITSYIPTCTLWERGLKHAVQQKSWLASGSHERA